MTMDATAWDERYAQGRVWSVEPNRFFAEIVGTLGVEPGTAVDLGCGEGRNAVWLAQQGWDVTAVDFSSVGIERGRAGAEALGLDVTWVVADLETHDLGQGAFDLVAVIYVHWPSERTEPFLRRAAAAVAPGGHLVIVGHDRTNIEHGHGGPQDPDVLSTPDELRSVAEGAGLDVRRAETVLRPVTLEPGHGAAADQAETVDAIDHVLVARRVSRGV